LNIEIYVNVSELNDALEKMIENIDETEEKLYDYFQEAGYYAKELAMMFAPIGVVKNNPRDLPHGKIMEAISVEQTSANSWKLIAAPVDSSGRHYAMAVEYGSNPWGGSKWVEGRPFMQPAVNMALQYFVEQQAIPLALGTFKVK
jgi:hypothetical protein